MKNSLDCNTYQKKIDDSGVESTPKIDSNPTDAEVLRSLLYIIPCSYVPNHTVDKLPVIVQELIDQSVQLSRIIDKAMSLRDETTEEEITDLLELILTE